MNLIRPSYEIIEQGMGLQGVYDIIENAGKTSYKSPVKGGDDAKKFVETRSNEKHGAVLEFGTVYLGFEDAVTILPSQQAYIDEAVAFYEKNKFSVVNAVPGIGWFVTTNFRVIVENHREEDLLYLYCNNHPSGHHEKRYCVRFTLDRFTGEEFLRHRVFSFCRESTRYCNYSKDKFNNNITFVIPPWIGKEDLAEGENIQYWDGDWVDMNEMKIIASDRSSKVSHWLNAVARSEMDYMELVSGHGEEKAWTPQMARTILPCAIKSPLAMCGFAHDWIHFFHLRVFGTTGAPHPQAKELAEPLMNEFIKRGYLTEEEIKAKIV